MNRVDLLRILASGDFEALLGIVEGAELDFKDQPYTTDSAPGKFELAKDVAAIANAGGGVIAIGVKTEFLEDRNLERVASTPCLPAGMVNEKQYRAILRGLVYPVPADISVEFYTSAKDRSRGLLAIDVPPDLRDVGPFLVCKPMVEEGGKPIGWLFGLPTRHKDTTDHLSVQDLHSAIRAGRARSGDAEVLEALSRIEAALASMPVERAPRAGHSLLARVESLVGLREGGATPELPFLVVAASPDGGSVRDFTGRDVREYIEAPPQTRPTGWGLITLNEARVIDGDHISIRSGDRLSTHFFRDGTLVAIATLPGFIARTGPTEPTFIVSLALIEFIYNALTVHVEWIERWMDVEPSTVTVRVELRNAHWKAFDSEYHVRLDPRTVSDPHFGIPLPGNGGTAPDERFYIARDFGVEHGAAPLYDVGAATFELTEGVFAWFRVTDEVPYSDARRVDPTLFP